MPAKRLRNQDWRRSLRQVLERGGSLDLAVATDQVANGESLRRQDDGDLGVNVLWRVRLLHIADDAIVVEQPTTLGVAVPLEEKIELVVMFTIGQNRWMFRTRNLGSTAHEECSGRRERFRVNALRLSRPARIERCGRRASYRVSTATLSLPDVEIWPLHDPKTVVVAERANELSSSSSSTQVAHGDSTGQGDGAERDPDSTLRLPDVGPKFKARLVNLGGGGVGLTVANHDSQSLLRNKLFWLRVSLPPHLDAPLCASAKLVHTHMTSSQEYYAGLAFDFTFNPAHQRFVVEQINRYVAGVQREQLARKSA